jgi:hypothetical protein
MCKQIITDNSDDGYERSSLSTHEKGGREINTDLTGSSDTENVASANRTTNLPSLTINGGWPGSTANSNQISRRVEPASSTSLRDTITEKGRSDEYPEKENSNIAPASFQERSRANANCLFSPSEAMFILQANSLGLEGACTMFFSFDPPVSGYIEAVQHLPISLRQIAEDLDRILKARQSTAQTVTQLSR